MKIIENNPYRILGVYANASVKERVASGNKLKAFLKVGRQPDFPLDIKQYLPPVARTAESVAKAEADLTLPNDQLAYAQFWFIKSIPLDDIAFNHLFAGNMVNAVDIWAKKDNVSSLQNRIVCALVTGDYLTAIRCAEKLYTQYSKLFVQVVLGDGITVTTDTLAYDFIDTLSDEVGMDAVLPHVTDAGWKKHLGDKAVAPLIAAIQSAVDAAKATRKQGPAVRLKAGNKLVKDTKTALAKLKKLLPKSDLQYQMIADKLGLEILQCGIDYYNGSEEPDAAHKAMKLQSYAAKVVVGSMAKGRCKENLDILQKIIDNLPPMEVFAENKAIKDELRRFRNLPENISNAITLLDNTKPHLQSIKAKLGAGNPYYLKMSTLVVSNALGYVIEEVNNAQKEETIEIQGRQIPISMLLDRETKIRQIKSALRSAWDATKMMDTFDMEYDFKTNRYNPNRSTLKGMCEQLGVSTLTWKPCPKPKPRPKAETQTPNKTPVPTDPSGNGGNTSDNSSSFGCFMCVIVILIAAMIGGLISGVFGAIMGVLMVVIAVAFIKD